MRRFALLCLPVLLVAACAAPTSAYVVPPDDPYGPVLVQRGVANVQAFELFALTEDATSPVVAVTPDHRLFRAMISPRAGWPMVGPAEGTPVELPRLPSEAVESDAVAMAASNDGMLHLAWDAGGSLRYVRMSADGAFDEPVILWPSGAREPNLVVAEGGRVIVGFTAEEEGDFSRADRVMIAEGTTDESGVTFGAPVPVNDGCCDEPELAHAMSGPSIAVGPSGEVHVVYEWSSFGRTVIDHVQGQAGVFSAPVVVTEAAFSPCPSIVVDSDGVAHIGFIRELERGVFYVTIAERVVSEPRVVYEPEDGRVTLALMNVDQDGHVHFGVTEGALHSRLLYVRLDSAEDLEPDVYPIHTIEDGILTLTMRAGGMLVAPDGKLLFAFRATYRGGGAMAFYAMGR